MGECGCRASGVTAALGVALAGTGLVGMGLWARRQVRLGLLRERIASGDTGKPVSSAAAARALADVIREQTLLSTEGRTYAETAEYLAPDGSPTGDEADALRDDATGRPVRNPDVDLWIRSTALQTALMQAYLAFKLADLMVALGGSLVLAGIGIGASAKR